MPYSDYVLQTRQIADLYHSIAVLSWDKEVYLPVKGAAGRSRQIATLSGMAHEMSTSESYGDLLRKLNTDTTLGDLERRNIALSLRNYNIATRFSRDFVEKKSAIVNASYHAWLKGRKLKDFKVFQPHLRKVVDLAREEAEIIGYEDHPYDALLDIYEKDLTVKRLEEVFGALKPELHDMLHQIRNAKQVSAACLAGTYSTTVQMGYGEKILQAMGYDFGAGRQDLAPHPFSISFGPGDQRVTTRVDERDLSYMLWSTIHEGGHALYEQGLPAELYGLPCGSAVSLGIHESQSRLWENHVGRSLDFWTHHYPAMQATYQHLQEVSLQDYYRAINRVSPGKIRTEADELHYHYHVLIRYEIERDLIAGDLSTDELHERWRDSYSDALGITIDHDTEGILQDIHWSQGSIGYFPTYTLGSLYAAQFFDQACEDLDDLPAQMRGGDTDALLGWLREKIHVHGQRYDAEDLCQRITGKTLDASHFIRYARHKWSDIYDIKL